MVWTGRKCSKAEQTANVVNSDRNWMDDAVGSLREQILSGDGLRPWGGANVITSVLHGVPVRRRRRA
eukprot:1398372-Heterocapsa_arctica.AAC.1